MEESWNASFEALCSSYIDGFAKAFALLSDGQLDMCDPQLAMTRDWFNRNRHFIELVTGVGPLQPLEFDYEQRYTKDQQRQVSRARAANNLKMRNAYAVSFTAHARIFRSAVTCRRMGLGEFSAMEPPQ